MERLRDDESEWGLTRVQYAQLAKRRLREREKKRRQRAMSARRPAQVVMVVQREQEVFETRTGILAVRGQAINRGALGSGAIRESTSYHDVSLPYLAFLHGPISRISDKGAER